MPSPHVLLNKSGEIGTDNCVISTENTSTQFTNNDLFQIMDNVVDGYNAETQTNTSLSRDISTIFAATASQTNEMVISQELMNIHTQTTNQLPESMHACSTMTDIVEPLVDNQMTMTDISLFVTDSESTMREQSISSNGRATPTLFLTHLNQPMRANETDMIDFNQPMRSIDTSISQAYSAMSTQTNIMSSVLETDTSMTDMTLSLTDNQTMTDHTTIANPSFANIGTSMTDTQTTMTDFDDFDFLNDMYTQTNDDILTKFNLLSTDEHNDGIISASSPLASIETQTSFLVNEVQSTHMETQTLDTMLDMCLTNSHTQTNFLCSL